LVLGSSGNETIDLSSGLALVNIEDVDGGGAYHVARACLVCTKTCLSLRDREGQVMAD